MGSRREEIYHIIAIVVVSIWGTTFVSTKLLLAAGLTPAVIFAIRFLIAYMAIIPFAGRKLWCDRPKDELMLAALGITGGSLYFIAENAALQITQASNVALIVCTTPVITTLMVYLCYRSERITAKTITGSLMALAGVALVAFNGATILKLSPAGDMLALAAAILWSIYSVILRRIGDRYPVVFISRKTFFYGLLTLLPYFIISPPDIPIEALLSSRVTANLLYLGVVASLACYALWSLACKHIGITRATNYLYINPMVTMISSAIILGERITPIALVGAAMILLGIYIAEHGKRARNR